METPAPSSNPHVPTIAHLSEVDWLGTSLFLLLTFAITWTVWIGLRALGTPFIIRSSIGMFGPALAVLLIRLIRHEGFADAGLRLWAKGLRGVGWIYLAAYLVSPLLIAASIGIVLLVGYQHWALSQNLQELANTIREQMGTRPLQSGMTATQLAMTSLIVQTILAFTVAIPINMLFTFGEEFGWRGYLLPRLAPLGGVPAAILVGLVWGLWHAPLIVLDSYNYPGYPWLGVLMMMVFCVSLSTIFAWLRFHSGSVWPSTLAHAAYNAQAGFALLVLSAGNPLLRAPIGLLGLVPMLLFALFLAATGRVKLKTPMPQPGSQAN